MVDKEIIEKGSMKVKDKKKETPLVLEYVAAITRWIGNLQIVDRRITRKDQSRINQWLSSRQVRESGLERHLVLL